MTFSLTLVNAERRLSSLALNARQSWSTRAACIVTLESADGVRGSGEAAPLPGFSPETLSDCQAALAALDVRALPTHPEPGHSVVKQLAREGSRLPGSVPAARAALEAALLDAWSRAAKKPAWALLVGSDAPPTPRAVSALLMGEPEQALEEAVNARERGLRTFKLKIGRTGMLEREVELVRRLREILPADARLRLDANQSFSPEQARHCLPRFAAHGIELVEEPCAFAALDFESTALPLALDESLSQLALESEPTRAAKVRGARALILKPALLGGISECYAWARVAKSVRAEVILSHTFDGPLGLALSAALALTIGSQGFAHGLDSEGARSEAADLPFFSGPHIRAWSEPGLGVRQAEP